MTDKQDYENRHTGKQEDKETDKRLTKKSARKQRD